MHELVAMCMNDKHGLRTAFYIEQSIESTPKQHFT